jgi:alpha-glucan,water dikinase
MEKETITTESGVVLSVEKQADDAGAELDIRSNLAVECFLHWGLRRRGDPSWQAPPPDSWPEGSRAFDERAIRSPFLRQDGQGRITIRFGKSPDFRAIDFVLFFPAENRWDNNKGKNYRIEIPGQPSPYESTLGNRAVAEIAEEIIEHETSRNSWTLMHRFNLCYDLLDRAKDTEEGLALVFVWLRYSFVRQLDWQRNYNTKPKELGHAMDRLTLKLAGIYGEVPERREMVRLIMTTLGRGSDAQRVRDEVLNIMHRHHIKEVSGHFMEEWHQKLHNNTTPDDIVICEAYLEFMRSNGNLERFYKTLNDGGVTKERLEGYERPIRSHPDFIPHLKDDLIRDFEHFLGILKAVHAGTDLGSAIHAARYLFDGDMHQLMDFIWYHHDDRKISAGQLSEKITAARRRLAKLLSGHQDRVRDLLFLDIALEDFLRIFAERDLGPYKDPNELVDLAASVLENLCLSGPGEELGYVRKQWERLLKMPRSGREWSLHAKAVADRMAAVVGESADRLNGLLQPKAEFLGKAFHVASWAVDLFSEEVVRGRPVFALSLVLRYLEPVLRKSAHLGNWQVISHGEGTAEVMVTEALKSVQGRSFSRPVLIVTDKVSGDEEISGGVVAIITPAVIDLLAHLAVRARNSGVLFATCYDSGLIDSLKSLRGRDVKVGIRGGDVVFEESRNHTETAAARPVSVRHVISRPSFTSYALTMEEFEEDNVGGKSNHLKRLRGKLPDWVGLPASAAIPFGVFEKVLTDKGNSESATGYNRLLAEVEKAGESAVELLPALREKVLGLTASDELVTSLRVVMEESGLPWPKNWEDAWTCIRKVWASKWNERAFLSRKANNIAHVDLFMAVLIQSVIAADYSYVIHTVNPFSEVREEIYAEAVRGLGEALVGNYPGKACSFSCRKGERQPLLLSFPSKREGLFGAGMIFRSDSNGEDLAGFAGAGLYDSFILPKPRRITLDYSADPLIWDDSFRKDFLVRIAEIGQLVEGALGPPQDIEGAYAEGKYFVVQTRPQVGIKDE